ncbi:hypothetical protein TcBrA4_0033570 [Trypanosoma cruzi]|nr:hypothetical protein TcBrA4_0033570 [Trypanosoma cruzi]
MSCDGGTGRGAPPDIDRRWRELRPTTFITPALPNRPLRRRRGGARTKLLAAGERPSASAGAKQLDAEASRAGGRGPTGNRAGHIRGLDPEGAAAVRCHHAGGQAAAATETFRATCAAAGRRGGRASPGCCRLRRASTQASPPWTPTDRTGGRLSLHQRWCRCTHWMCGMSSLVLPRLHRCWSPLVAAPSTTRQANSLHTPLPMTSGPEDPRTGIPPLNRAGASEDAAGATPGFIGGEIVAAGTVCL